MRTNYPTLSGEQIAHYNQQGYLVVEKLLTAMRPSAPTDRATYNCTAKTKNG